jgi:pyridoxamine 5'-phosphate oxidase
MSNDKEAEVISKKSVFNELSESTVNKDPFVQFGVWYKEAFNTGIKEFNAMIISTASKSGVPSVRTVLLKGFDKRGFVFYTNYGSRKSKDFEENPKAALLFLWKELERQIRITGGVEKVTREESETYFRSRPIESQLGAWASKQSELIPNREHLEKEYEKYKQEFEGKEVPAPPNWGGYRLIPREFEFWQGRESRLHDRICYFQKGGVWHIYRLSP